MKKLLLLGVALLALCACNRDDMDGTTTNRPKDAKELVGLWISLVLVFRAFVIPLHSKRTICGMVS